MLGVSERLAATRSHLTLMLARFPDYLPGTNPASCMCFVMSTAVCVQQ